MGYDREPLKICGHWNKGKKSVKQIKKKKSLLLPHPFWGLSPPSVLESWRNVNVYLVILIGTSIGRITLVLSV